MSMPGFFAEASLSGPHTDYRSMTDERQIDTKLVTPQFCFCECRLRRICFIPWDEVSIPYTSAVPAMAEVHSKADAQ